MLFILNILFSVLGIRCNLDKLLGKKTLDFQHNLLFYPHNHSSKHKILL